MQASHTSPILRVLAQAITKAREAAGMKQVVAAKALCIARSTLSKYENGRQVGEIKISLLLSMSQLYRQPLQSFFSSSTSNESVVTGEVSLAPSIERSPEQLAHLKDALLFLVQRLPQTKK